MDTSFIGEDMKNPKGRIYWRILIVLCLLFYPVVFYFGLNSKKNIEFMGLKIKGVDTVYLTKQEIVYKEKVDTFYKYIPSPGKSSTPRTEQKNTNGPNNSAGRDNNGTQAKNVFVGRADSGSKVHVGDIVNNNAERVLTEIELMEILVTVNNFREKNRMSKCILPILEQGASQRIMQQVEDYLISHGYDVEPEGAAFGTPEAKFSVGKNIGTSCVVLNVGLYK